MGIVEQLDILGNVWLPALIAIVPVTFLVFTASGKITDFIIRRQKDA